MARAVNRTVRQCLAEELAIRELLLPPATCSAAVADAARTGQALLGRLLELCYSDVRTGGQQLSAGYADRRDQARVHAGLAFGSVTGRLLAGPAQWPPAEDADLLCATFNFGIGLVDGLADTAPHTGLPLLRHLSGLDLRGAACRPRTGPWLRARVPSRDGEDPAVQFTLRVVEGFFACLHACYPGDPGAEVRGAVANRLEEALEAELRSVSQDASASVADRVAWSRQTSVVPFQVIEHLATGDAVVGPAGRLLGEAAWRIDDLTDLVGDAERGALNAVLAAAAAESDDVDVRDALGVVLASPAIRCTAADAARTLAEGLNLVRDDWRHDAGAICFLSFLHEAAGLGA